MHRTNDCGWILINTDYASTQICKTGDPRAKINQEKSSQVEGQNSLREQSVYDILPRDFNYYSCAFQITSSPSHSHREVFHLLRQTIFLNSPRLGRARHSIKAWLQSDHFSQSQRSWGESQSGKQNFRMATSSTSPCSILSTPSRLAVAMVVLRYTERADTIKKRASQDLDDEERTASSITRREA